MKLTSMLRALGLMLAFALAAVSTAHAQSTLVWNPTTAAGGAPVNPDYWDDRAAIVHGSSAGNVGNITIAPTQNNTVVHDNSVHTTEVQGGQTNVAATGQLTNGGTFTVTTGTGSATTTGPNSSTTVTSNSTLGDGSTVTNTTSTTTGSD